MEENKVSFVELLFREGVVLDIDERVVFGFIRFFVFL